MRDTIDKAALAGIVALGIWLIAAPAVIGSTDGPRVSHLVTGPIVAAIAVVSMSAVARSLIRIDALLGGWLVLAPLIVPHGTAWWESVVVGLAILLLALVPRSQAGQFGGGWAVLVGRRKDAPSGTHLTSGRI